MSSNNNQTERDYSRKLFDGLYKTIESDLCENEKFKNLKLTFKGLWAFAYLKGANVLRPVYFNHVDLPNLKLKHENIIAEIETKSLDCDYGSLGHYFKEYFKKQETVEFLFDTYYDAKGTVCYYDAIIEQQHACFVIIKHEQEVLGTLDFFFTGTKDITAENTIKDYLQNEKLLDDFFKAFKIEEFDYFLRTQKTEEDEKRSNLLVAIEHIEQLIAKSSQTPLLIISRKNSVTIPGLVCLNFDFIHSIIKHEHRFCPLTTDNKACPYFKSELALTCHNEFLSNYYFNVLSALNAKIVQKPIVVNEIEYQLEIACAKEYNLYNFNIDTDIIHIQSEIDNKSLNGLAANKYRDERIYLLIGDKLKDDDSTYAFSLSRKAKPYLKFCSNYSNQTTTDCEIRNNLDLGKPLKQFISPSNILPIQYENRDVGTIFTRKEDSENKNIVHFKITNEKIFIEILKKLIAATPSKYLQILSPYINQENREEKYRSLLLKFVGDNPITEKNEIGEEDKKYAAIIEGKLNLIEAILEEEETKRYARRAAISQVLARNMSHNHGSHTLSRMVHRDQVSGIYEENEEVRNKLAKKLLG